MVFGGRMTPEHKRVLRAAMQLVKKHPELYIQRRVWTCHTEYTLLNRITGETINILYIRDNEYQPILFPWQRPDFIDKPVPTSKAGYYKITEVGGLLDEETQIEFTTKTYKYRSQQMHTYNDIVEGCRVPEAEPKYRYFGQEKPSKYIMDSVPYCSKNYVDKNATEKEYDIKIYGKTETVKFDPTDYEKVKRVLQLARIGELMMSKQKEILKSIKKDIKKAKDVCKSNKRSKK